ncbi:MATE family efflux transporter [Ruminococcus albus]|uniref:Probable multidrug resistance protein NorM n=1 Tax=Ruminococcus albus TaxID=1264 RepID=A0A1H7J0L0_RUMAL|nr:MATE family efflux transporter [Ruminococcus albus]SEK67964.1 putative efflux protein, MATE family [Ruminococcus albus]
MSRSRIMTEGSEIECIISFTLPLLAGNLLQQTYNFVDTMIVGKYLGDDSLAAVGATGSITYLFYTLCIGLSIGAGVLISQYFGAARPDRVRAAVVNSAVITLIFAIVATIPSVLFARQVLTFLGVKANLLGRAATYMQIACAGTICVAAYNWINSVMRALGDSKTPLIFLIVSTILNVILDLLFVMVFKMGIGGAAFATVLAQGISAGSCIIYCFKTNTDIRPKEGEWKIDPKLIQKCITTGIPIAAQNGLISLSMVALQSVTNRFDESIMTAYTATMRIEQLVHQPYFSMSAAVTAFTGQNIGAGKQERAVKGYKSSMKIGSIFAAVMFVLFAFFGRNVIGIFVNGNHTKEIGALALIITGSCYIPLGAIHITRGFLNGAGDTGYSLVNGISEVFCRIFFSFVLTRIPYIGWRGIWITTALTWAITGAVSILRYKSGKWKLKAVK